jgi:hypothetical protein
MSLWRWQRQAPSLTEVGEALASLGVAGRRSEQGGLPRFNVAAAVALDELACRGPCGPPDRTAAAALGSHSPRHVPREIVLHEVEGSLSSGCRGRCQGMWGATSPLSEASHTEVCSYAGQTHGETSINSSILSTTRVGVPSESSNH